MNLFFCDTSALAKRYVPEAGTAQINHLLATLSRARLFMLAQALGEILSVIVRRRNGGVISSALDLAARVRPAGHSVVLVNSDTRLFHAATAEGLTVFNPETDSDAQLDALIAAA